MARIRLINEPSELALFLRLADSEVKREMLEALASGWLTEGQIRERWGEEGASALQYFIKLRVLDTRWEATPRGPVRAYSLYFDSVQINLTIPMTEISDILAAAMMPDEEVLALQERIISIMGKSDRVFIGDVASNLGVSVTMLRCIVGRAPRLNIKGHYIIRT